MSSSPILEHAEESAESAKSSAENALNELTEMLQETLKKTLDSEEEKDRELSDFSDGFAGIVYAIMQMGQTGELSQQRAISLMQLFYHFDTGKFLHHSKIEELVNHKKCMDYAKSLEENIVAYNRRREKFRLNETIDDIARSVENDTPTDAEGANASAEEGAFVSLASSS